MPRITEVSKPFYLFSLMGQSDFKQEEPVSKFDLDKQAIVSSESPLNFTNFTCQSNFDFTKGNVRFRSYVRINC